MTHTKDYEHLLECKNVRGVEYDEDGDRVISFVTKKENEEDLADEDIVANNVDKDSDVVEIGDIRALDLPAAQGDRNNRHRPVPGGVSEINSSSTAATGGPYPVEVVDKSRGVWGDNVSEGDRVRLSNNHVYARVDKADFGESIIQPSPRDGGSAPDDRVGELCGRVPIEDGVTVDLAARTVDEDQESEGYHEVPSHYGNAVLRDYSGLRGARVVKTGRTTGVTEGDVQATSATITVGYPEGNVRLRDQIVTTDMSKGGDSGSPLFRKSDGALVGEIYAGSNRASIAYKAANIEKELGVKLMETEDSDKKFLVSLDATVTIDMEPADLDIEELSGDEPKPGETIEADAEFSGSAEGEAWVEAQGERYTFEMHENEDGSITGATTIALTAPDELRESFDVNITGGYVY